MKKRNGTLTDLNMNQSYPYQHNQNIKPELFIKGNTRGVIDYIVQYDKQFRKLQQQDGLIHNQKRLQKRFSMEQTKWFQWPSPCSDDNHCPPNLYCVNGNCWHLSNKPIRVQRIHDSLMKKGEQKKSDISHLIINPLYRSAGDTFTPSENMVTNLSEFQNSDFFGYTTNSVITSVVASTTTTKTLHQLNTTKLKTTISNRYMKRKQSTTTNSNLIWLSTHKLDLFVGKDNLSKSSFNDLRFSTEFPDCAEYTRQQRFDKPIRIELYLAKAVPRNECSQDSHCGHRMICCRKQWNA
ncbi:Uncharacterized protein ACO02O_05158 [Dirofilaria immitis]